MPAVVAVAAGECFPPLVDAAINILALVNAAAAANGLRKCTVLPLVTVVADIGNDANILPRLPPPQLPAALRVQ